jgi:hypothetical protein
LTQGVEHVAVELCELVEKQDAVMGKGSLSPNPPMSRPLRPWMP